MFNWMTQDVVIGIFRHLLTLGGGYLIAKGHASQEQIDSLVKGLNDPTLIGAVVSGIGIVMSYIHKTQVQAAVVTALNTPAPSQTITVSK